MIVFTRPLIISAQTAVNYNDVAVIVNKNDSVSVAIGNYFKTKRNIPDKNIMSIDVLSQEEISDSVFTSMRHQIEQYLLNNHLDTSINYLVTTKGCPLKVLRASNDTDNCNSSVESELMLILGIDSGLIGNCGTPSNPLLGSVSNPYLNATDNFSHIKYSIYLVTRLDAYTIQNVYHIIDHSGPYTYVNKDSVLFVFDATPNWASQPLNNFAYIKYLLNTRGWKVLYNTDTVYVTHQKNVIGYQSWGSNDGHTKYYTDSTGQPYNTWSDGSIVETNVSTSARSFQPGTTYGQSLIADWLKEGATGAKGYLYEPFTDAIANHDILFDRYTLQDAYGFPKYNLAESYFAASALLGWKDVVVGDPKTSITSHTSASVKNYNIDNNILYIFPNPADGKFSLYYNNWQYNNKSTVTIFTVTGKIIWQDNIAPSKGDISYSIDISSYSKGVYILKFQHENETIIKKVIIY